MSSNEKAWVAGATADTTGHYMMPMGKDEKPAAAGKDGKPAAK